MDGSTFKDSHAGPRSRRIRTPVLVVVLAALAACGGGSPELAAPASPFAVGGLQRAELSIGRPEKLKLDVELALSPGEQARGLMGVEQMPDGYGMVFLWDSPGVRSFYMKDTLIPLDIAWWDAGGAVVDIQTMTPCTAEPCPMYPPGAPHVAAVEVNAGLLERAGVQVGDPVTLTRGRETRP